MTDQTATLPPSSQIGNAGQYLTFRIGEETYGIQILKVREIIRTIDITRVPGALAFYKGVINLRGKVIPVISLRLRLGFAEIDFDEETSIIVVETVSEIVGVVIDAVSDVITVGESDLEPAPRFGSDSERDFILCMSKAADRIVTLLDIDAVLAVEDFAD